MLPLTAGEVPRPINGHGYSPRELYQANWQRRPAQPDSSKAACADASGRRQQLRLLRIPTHDLPMTAPQTLRRGGDQQNGSGTSRVSLGFMGFRDVDGTSPARLGEQSGDQQSVNPEYVDQGDDDGDSDIGDEGFLVPWFHAINCLRVS